MVTVTETDIELYIIEYIVVFWTERYFSKYRRVLLNAALLHVGIFLSTGIHSLQNWYCLVSKISSKVKSREKLRFSVFLDKKPDFIPSLDCKQLRVL